MNRLSLLPLSLSNNRLLLVEKEARVERETMDPAVGSSVKTVAMAMLTPVRLTKPQAMAQVGPLVALPEHAAGTLQAMTTQMWTERETAATRKPVLLDWVEALTR
jgi:hypothetical protein